jgi:hypothetical protein
VHSDRTGKGSARGASPLVLDVDDTAIPEPGGGLAGARHGRVRRAAQRQVRAAVRRPACHHHPRAGAAAELGVRTPHLVARAAADAAPVQRGPRRGREEPVAASQGRG